MRQCLVIALILAAALFLLAPPAVLAQDFCQGNFDYDDDVDGTDAAVFKMHFGIQARFLNRPGHLLTGEPKLMIDLRHGKPIFKP